MVHHYLPLLSVAEAGIRRNVCDECDRRPAGSEALAADVPRACEAACAVFLFLPRLVDLVRRYGQEPPCGYESAVRNLVRHAREGRVIDGGGPAGDGGVPLERHCDATIAVIEQLAAGRKAS
ncbi:MAG TPA: hypothetical protein VF796_08015 [Humisphaera sp.]